MHKSDSLGSDASDQGLLLALRFWGLLGLGFLFLLLLFVAKAETSDRL